MGFFMFKTQLEHKLNINYKDFESVGKYISRWFNSYSRLPEIIELHSKADTAIWLKILGDNWSACDNISQYLLHLKKLMPRRTAHEMMEPDEYQQFEQLPNLVTIYRGCSRENIDGACYSLNIETAKSFVRLNRYQVEHPILVTATVYKHEVIALKNDREEHEIITFDANIIHIEPLTINR